MNTKIACIAISLLLLCNVLFAQTNSSPKGWMPKEIRPIRKEFPGGFMVSVGSTVVFSNGISLTSDMVRPRYLGQLQTDKLSPFFIFQANTCDACDETPLVRIVSQSDHILREATNKRLPAPPGRLFAFGPEHRIISQSRMFYGDCLKNHNQVAVWFIRTMQANGKWKHSVFIVEVVNGNLKTKSLSDRLPNINEPLDRLKKGCCYEVPGKDITQGP
jgi:hypothetical protein